MKVLGTVPYRFGTVVLPLLVLSAVQASYAGRLLFVGDGGSFTLQSYDSTGNLTNSDGAGGSIGFPKGIAIGPDGNAYLADSGNGQVLRFSGATGSYLGVFIAPGTGGMTAPSGLAFGFGNLFAADYGTGGNSFINVYNGTTGAFLTQFGAGAPNGGLFDPNGVVFGPNGLYVTDQINGVDVYNPSTGAFVNVLVPIGSGPSAPAGLATPSGIAIGPDGKLYVADETSGVVDQFNATTGAFLGIFGATNSLSSPIDLKFGPDGNLYVTDSLGVERFNGSTGASMGTFVLANSGFSNPQYLAFNTPEPSALALFAFGGVALIGFRKRLRG